MLKKKKKKKVFEWKVGFFFLIFLKKIFFYFLNVWFVIKRYCIFDKKKIIIFLSQTHPKQTSHIRKIIKRCKKSNS